jgi:hypothetical protein
MRVDFSTRYRFDNLVASATGLREKASLEARALPSRTRDLTLSGQNHYKGGLDAPRTSLEAWPLLTRSLAGYN